jgi:branched-chain amino acid transport system substrate-binding protein
VPALENSLRANRNDPEALIYLNNARIGEAQSYTIAIAVPAEAAQNPALEVLRGVAQAQTEVNQAGGINNVPLRVVIADDGNTPETATQLAQTLVDRPEVLAVVGHFSSDVSIATAPIYTTGTLPVMSPTSTSVQISGLSDYFFRTVPSDRFAATALARYVLQTLKQQRVAIFFNSESAYSRSLKDEFTTALFSDGGQVVAEIDLIDPAFRANQTIQQIQAQDTEIIFLAANTPTLDQALAIITANNGQLPLLGGDSLYNPKILEIGASQAEGMVIAIPWHILAYANAPFVTASRQQWGGDVNWRSVMAYDAVKSLATAMSTLSSVDRSSLQAALSDPSFTAEGATSEVKFLPSGDRNQAVQLVTITPGTRSGYGYDFVPIATQSN